MFFIIAQVLGVIILLITVISIQQKTKERILICQITANILDAIQYFLLNAITGGVIGIINVIRCFIFYYYKKNDKKPSFLFLCIFVIVAIVSGILSWQSVWSIIPIIVSIVFTYGLWQDNVKITRICTAITAGGWSAYQLIFLAYARVIGSVSELLSAIISIIRYDIRKKDKEEYIISTNK